MIAWLVFRHGLPLPSAFPQLFFLECHLGLLWMLKFQQRCVSPSSCYSYSHAFTSVPIPTRTPATWPHVWSTGALMRLSPSFPRSSMSSWSPSCSTARSTLSPFSSLATRQVQPHPSPLPDNRRRVTRKSLGDPRPCGGVGMLLLPSISLASPPGFPSTSEGLVARL